MFSDVLGERKFAELVCRKAGTSFSETELGKHDQDFKGIKQGGFECQQHLEICSHNSETPSWNCRIEGERGSKAAVSHSLPGSCRALRLNSGYSGYYIPEL